MIGIDSNVLIRLLVNDQQEQAQAAADLLRDRGSESVRVANVVIAETVWVLGRHYRQEKAKIIEIIVLLLGREELVFEGRSALMTALNWYERGKADFADYLIAASNAEAGASPTYTFDQNAATHPLFAELPTRTN